MTNPKQYLNYTLELFFKNVSIFLLTKNINKKINNTFELEILWNKNPPLFPLDGGISNLVVPEAGIEPARYRYRWILSPVRLPVSPLGQSQLQYYREILKSIKEIIVLRLRYLFLLEASLGLFLLRIGRKQKE